jgi:hypothetical protein
MGTGYQQHTEDKECNRVFHGACYDAERFAITGSAPLVAEINPNVVAESVCMALLGRSVINNQCCDLCIITPQ